MTPERIAEHRAGVVHDKDCPEESGACSYDCIHNNLDEMLDEIERLRRWKAEATEVIARWEDVALLVPFDSSTLGQSKADVVKNEIARLDALVELRTRKWMDANGQLDDVRGALSTLIGLANGEAP